MSAVLILTVLHVLMICTCISARELQPQRSLLMSIPDKTQEEFDYFDYDGDGELTASEFAHYLETITYGKGDDYMDGDDYVQVNFPFADVDGNRKLNINEFLKAKAFMSDKYHIACWKWAKGYPNSARRFNSDYSFISIDDLKETAKSKKEWDALYEKYCQAGELPEGLRPFYSRDWLKDLEALFDYNEDGQVTETEASHALFGKNGRSPFFWLVPELNGNKPVAKNRWMSSLFGHPGSKTGVQGKFGTKTEVSFPVNQIARRISTVVMYLLGQMGAPQYIRAPYQAVASTSDDYGDK